VVVFLQRYRKSYSYVSDSEFLSAFGYAIYDFLEEGKAKRYSTEFIRKLEAIEEETFHTSKKENSHLTKKLLKECLSGKYEKFSKELSYFLITFLPIRAEQDLNIQSHRR
jgi:SPX domain protein involved in polyphosphate accumulation